MPPWRLPADRTSPPDQMSERSLSWKFLGIITAAPCSKCRIRYCRAGASAAKKRRPWIWRTPTSSKPAGRARQTSQPDLHAGWRRGAVGLSPVAVADPAKPKYRGSVMPAHPPRRHRHDPVLETYLQHQPPRLARLDFTRLRLHHPLSRPARPPELNHIALQRDSGNNPHSGRPHLPDGGPGSVDS
jgi:hypothetical protein